MLRAAQEQAGVPAGRWTGRGLAVLGLAPGEEVTEAQLRNLFGERGRHPDADRIEADLLAQGVSLTTAFKAGALGRRVMVTGVGFVFRPQPTIYLLRAMGDEETRGVIEVAHERAIVRVLGWIEDEVAVIRYGKDGVYRVRPPGGLVAARFRHYEARSGMPLLHDHVLLSVKGQRLDGKWGSIHTTALHENTVAASALYNELVAAEVCEALGLATEPRTVTPGRRPVTEMGSTERDAGSSGASHPMFVNETVIAMLRPKPDLAKLADDPPHVRAAAQAAVEAPAGIGTIASYWTEVPLPATGTWNAPGKGGAQADVVVNAPQDQVPLLFVEVDNCHESAEELADKLEKYARFFRRKMKDTDSRERLMWRTPLERSGHLVRRRVAPAGPAGVQPHRRAQPRPHGPAPDGADPASVAGAPGGGLPRLRREDPDHRDRSEGPARARPGGSGVPPFRPREQAAPAGGDRQPPPRGRRCPRPEGEQGPAEEYRAKTRRADQEQAAKKAAEREARRPVCADCGARFTDERWEAVEVMDWGTPKDIRPHLCDDCKQKALTVSPAAGIRERQEHEQDQAVPEQKATSWFSRLRG
ncbi:MobF family relaxase [Streptomyces liangshanensis]|uniref:MobF family relaxase n=1 Tax=Streptomyces liangshanensis TaxID=2717324 RepID=UPI001AAE6723|nr:MobF family relaxase [Streptomyces liangshanensis]